VPSFSFSSSGSPSPFLISPSGIVTSTLMLYGLCGSQWMYLVRFAGSW